MHKIVPTKTFCLKPKIFNLQPGQFGREAFTLVEVLIVVAVTALLSSFLLVYNNNSRKQIALFVEQAKIAQIITKAKSQAISTYATGGGVAVCGYGVQFNYAEGSYDIFRYEYDRDCDTLTRATAVFDDFHVKPVEGLHFTLNQSLEFNGTQDDAVSYVLFVPPDPRTIIRVGDVSRSSGSIYVKAKNSQESAKVMIGSAGQINY